MKCTHTILSALIMLGVGILFLSSFGTAGAAGKAAPPWKAPASSSAKKNPIPFNKASIKLGKKIYLASCVACHGSSGKGNGAAAVALPIRPGNLTEAANKRVQSDGSLFWKISVGRGSMPPFKGAMKDSDKWHLVNYLRTLAK